ncbi:hypothetical protein TNCV_3746691 [Trichonephila clavipes]|nr:hypothetical protein TNCV_3746691 [Trichonephila clavipes]
MGKNIKLLENSGRRSPLAEEKNARLSAFRLKQNQPTMKVGVVICHRYKRNYLDSKFNWLSNFTLKRK